MQMQYLVTETKLEKKTPASVRIFRNPDCSVVVKPEVLVDIGVCAIISFSGF